ncbi:DUF3159 domain-containing protein [Paraconexibacter algicola]|uniref:DUF3159 domain-containing protein n=1 Tax=Paraconexibacter algicola TaxID=2133960 RepID=A0A2T4UHY4_9ACTN|nr:DUF3159 domain-containing protein [Paraconexibacter algicola]
MVPDQPDAQTRPSEAPPSALADAIGGPLGIAESALPAAAFVAASTASGGDTTLAAIVAVALALVLALARIVRGQTVQYALSGLIGVGFAAFIAARTGKAENFFLPGLLANAGYAAAFAVSITLRRPLAGYVAVAVAGGNPLAAWREDPAYLRVATRASWVFVGVFAGRLAVQLPLYLADALVALGVARVAMGLPLFALGGWLAWLLMRGVPIPAVARPDADRDATSDDDGPPAAPGRLAGEAD